MRSVALIILLYLPVAITGYPQLVYLHSDKSEYEAGETIWFRVYLLDEKTMKPLPGPENVYINLFNTNSLLVRSKILLAGDGFATGDMEIPISMPDGNYVLQAHSSQRTFESHIYIYNPGYEDRIPRREVRFNRRFNRNLARIRENLPAGRPGQEEPDAGWNPQLSLTPEISLISSGEQEYISLRIHVRDEANSPARGTFSFSAVVLPADEELSVRQTLEELTGQFSKPDIRGSHETADTTAFGGLSVAGRLVDPASDEVVRMHPVSLKIISEEETIIHSQTDQYGTFRFGGLFFTGRVNAEISSKSLLPGYPPKFILDVRETPDFRYTPGTYTRLQRLTARGPDWQRVRRTRIPAGDTETRTEVRPQRYGVPDQTIYIDQERTPVRLIDVLNRDLYAIGGQIVLNEALYYVDNVQVPAGQFMNLPSRDFERLEIFRGARASVFDRGSSSGVILAWSRLPGYTGPEETLSFEMEGYHTPREFIPWDGNQLSPATLHWEPAILSGDDGILHIHFPYDHNSGDLEISIEGIGANGNPGSARLRISPSRR